MVSIPTSPSIVPTQELCCYLGGGDAQSASHLIAASDIELVPMQRYSAWMTQSWGIRVETHANKS
jgi:hypothetical protein